METPGSLRHELPDRASVRIRAYLDGGIQESQAPPPPQPLQTVTRGYSWRRAARTTDHGRAKLVKEGTINKGVVGLIFNTIGVSDGISMGTPA